MDAYVRVYYCSIGRFSYKYTRIRPYIHTFFERSSNSPNPALHFLRDGCGMRVCGVRALALQPALVRWYVLLLVCSQQVLNALICLTWSPVGNTASRVFG